MPHRFRWLVLYTRPRYEKKVARQLSEKIYTSLEVIAVTPSCLKNAKVLFWWLYVCSFIIAACCVVLLFYVPYNTPVGVDAGYYLQVAREVAAGTTPYVELYYNYSPIGPYIYALVGLICGFDAYAAMLNAQYASVLLSSVLLVVAFRRLNVRTAVVLVGTFAYAATAMMLLQDIKLEAWFLPVATALIAVFIESQISGRSIWYFSYGVGVSVAFCVKQYAVLLIIPLVAMAWYQAWRYGNSCRTQIALLIAGSILGLSGVLLGVGMLHAEPLRLLGHLPDVMTQLLGRVPGGATYGDFDVVSLLNIPRYLLLFWPASFLTLLMPAGWTLIDQHDRIGRQVYLFCGIGGLIMMSTLVVKVFPHYVLFSLPFMAMAAAIVINRWIVEGASLRVWILSFLLVFPSALSLRAVIFLPDGRATRLHHQQAVTRSLLKMVPSQSRVFLLSNRYLWYTCDYRTPVPVELGYGFVKYDVVRSVTARFQPGDRIMTSARSDFHGFNLNSVVDLQNGDSIFIYQYSIVAPY